MNIKHKIPLLMAACLAFLLPFPVAAMEPAQIAAILAGTPVQNEFAFSATYQKKVDAAWKRYESAVGLPLASWSSKEIGKLAYTGAFYPFSGPDFLTINRVYPDAMHYTLVSLQKAKRPLAIDRLSPKAKQKLEAKMGEAWEKFGKLGFFRTHDLDNDQADSLSLGATSILLAFSARLGYIPLSVRPLSFSEADSQWIPADDDSSDWRSVRIALSKAGKVITLDYISLDLSDPYLMKSAALCQWIDERANAPVFLKAASHLLQKPSFSVLRQSLLKQSRMVVQDETGLNYDDLKTIGKTRLYGNFVKTHALFKSTRQSALANAYQTASPPPPPLPFAFSYLKGAGFCSMQIANR